MPFAGGRGNNRGSQGSQGRGVNYPRKKPFGKLLSFLINGQISRDLDVCFSPIKAKHGLDSTKCDC